MLSVSILTSGIRALVQLQRVIFCFWVENFLSQKRFWFTPLERSRSADSENIFFGIFRPPEDLQIAGQTFAGIVTEETRSPEKTTLQRRSLPEKTTLQRRSPPEKTTLQQYCSRFPKFQNWSLNFRKIEVWSLNFGKIAVQSLNFRKIAVWSLNFVKVAKQSLKHLFWAVQPENNLGGDYILQITSQEQLNQNSI